MFPCSVPVTDDVAVPIRLVRSKNSTLDTFPLGVIAAAANLMDDGAAASEFASGDSSATTGRESFSSPASENASAGTTSRGVDVLDHRTRQIMNPSGDVYSTLNGTFFPAVIATLALVYSPPSPFHWSITSWSSTHSRTRRCTST